MKDPSAVIAARELLGKNRDGARLSVTHESFLRMAIS